MTPRFVNRVLCCLVAITPGLFLASVVQAQDPPKRVMAGVRFHGNTSTVSVVVQGGPASRAGIEVGDEILSIDESYILQPVDMIVALNGKRPGDAVRCEVKRGSEIMFVNLTLVKAVKGDQVIGDDGEVQKAPPKLGILNEMAPELEVDLWHDLPKGMKARFKEMRGHVVCLLLFQNDCEFSRRQGIPQVQKIHDTFADDPEVIVLSIQTPFRNFDDNTHGNAIRYFDEIGLDIPLGHDGSADIRTVTYDAFLAPGTPWIVVIDKKGIVRYNDSRLPLNEAKQLFAELKSEESESR